MAKKIRFKFPKSKIDVEMLSLITIMVLFGLVMVGSASSVTALYRFNNSMHFLSKQIVVALAGFVAMIVVSHIDYHKLATPKMLIAAYLIVWIAMLLAGLIGEDINGARRWISIGGLTVQPSEPAKIVLILVVAYICSIQSPKSLNSFKGGFMLYMLIIGFSAVPLLVEKHKSATMIFALVVVTMALLGGARLKYYLLTAPVAGVGIVAWFLFDEYSRNRITGMFNPFLDAQNTGYQASQSLYAIGSGGIFGLGFGRSQQKIMYIPEPQNDFIFSIICEELGMVGAIAVFILFICFMFRGIKIAAESPDKLGKLIALGLTALIMYQFVINIAVVTATGPVTGMPLPFFSAGGTNLLFTLASMGLLLNVSRHSVKKRNELNQQIQ